MAVDTRGVFDKNLRLALKASAFEVQEEARSNHRYKQRNGRLKDSVDVEMSNTGLQATVFLNTNIAPYGPFVHEGSAPRMILPKNKQTLRWVSDGSFVFSKKVRHPGYKGDPFLYYALDNKRDDVEEIFLKYTNKSLEEVANVIRGTTYIFGR